MEDVEYNNIKIPISEVERIIQAYRRKIVQNETTETVIAVLEGLIENYTLVK